MSMVNLPNLMLVIKGQVADAVRGLRTVRGETERTSGVLGSFADAGKMAAGVLIRDLVRGATATVDEMFRLGAIMGTVSTSFDRLVAASGSSTMSLDNLRNATYSMVKDVDLLQAANQAMMLGLPIDELDEMYNSAIRVGGATGLTATKAINDFTIALGRQQPKILDNFGIKLQLSEAEELYAQQLGKSVSALTDEEKETAFATIAIQKMNEQAGILGENISDATMRQNQWAASWGNLTTRIGEFLTPLSAIQPILNPAMNMMGIMAGTLLPKLIAKLSLATAAEWAHVVALKAHAVASAIAQGISSMGLAVPLIAAAAIAAGAIAYSALSRIPSRQFGGPVEETGPHMLHKGEFVLTEDARKMLLASAFLPFGGMTGAAIASSRYPGPKPLTINISNMTVHTRDANDFVKRMRALGIGS